MIDRLNCRTEKECPSCRRKSIICLGRLDNMEGVICLKNPGNLYQCRYCGLYFRRPYLPLFELERQYSKTPDIFWSAEHRPEYNIAANFISTNISSGKILDIGCFSGEFLERLPDTYSKYGVELAKSARKIAQKRGVTLIGTSIDNVSIDQPMFHVITLIDVIEHLPYPFKALQKLKKLLLPEGIILISTGNTNVLPWRLMRLDYWYYFTEHVSFFNPRWFRWASQLLNFDILMVKEFSHFKASIFERWYQFIQCLVFWMWKRADLYLPLKRLISSFYPFDKVSQWSLPPQTKFWKDHIMVVYKLIGKPS